MLLSLRCIVCRQTDKKNLLKKSHQLQKDAAKLQRDFEKAVLEQSLGQEFRYLSEGPTAAGTDTRDTLAENPALSSVSPAALQMLLLKVKIFRKTVREIGNRSRSIKDELQHLRDMISAESGGHSAEDTERLQSLSVTGVLLAQTEAEAETIFSAYSELEASLEDAGKAVDEARAIRLQNALQRAVKLITETASSSKP